MRPEFDVDHWNQRGADCLPGLVGFEMVSIGEDRITCRLEVKRELMAPNGFLHAAAVIALADTACGYGVFAHLPEGAVSFATVELKANFIGTVRDGAIRCEAVPAHLGGTTQVWDAVVSDEVSGKRIALFRCTQLLLMQRGPGK